LDGFFECFAFELGIHFYYQIIGFNNGVVALSGQYKRQANAKKKAELFHDHQLSTLSYKFDEKQLRSAFISPPQALH
jgi:hypothetical protein